MPVQILMPALSPTMTEGNLVKWCKNPGDIIKAGQVLAEIETDKATMEVEAVDEGILGKILVPAGTEEVKVNTLIALLLEEGEDASALDSFTADPVIKPAITETSVASSTKASEPLPHTPTIEGNRIVASPVAKRLASSLGLSLDALTGTGPRGRIVKSDVENAAQNPTSVLAAMPELQVRGHTDLPLNTMRKTIAKRLVESKQTIPHFYLSISCAIDELLAMRQKMNERREKHEKISVNDFVILAVAKSLQAVPDVNVTFHDTFIRRYNQADVSVAVALEGGLVTPIITNASQRSLGNISNTMKSLADRAKKGQLKPEEFQGGSFCISNLGMYGIEQFQAIINPPQGCILAVGAGILQPIIKDGQITQATMMTCTLSVDHRAVDGALGASFLKVFKEFLENPVTLFV